MFSFSFTSSDIAHLCSNSTIRKGYYYQYTISTYSAGLNMNKVSWYHSQVVHIENGQKLGPNQEGELWIKSPLRMKGYMGDPAASDALIDSEGYVRTGDIGYYDTDGFFYIVDRLKELIKYKGFQVTTVPGII